MKRKLAAFSIFFIFIAGIFIMSYPLLSSVINNLSSRSRAEEYTNTTKQMSSKETLEMLSKAESYNKSLTNNAIIIDPFDEDAYKKIGANYEKSLNVDNNGLIGYVDVPKINVYLPVYHGTTSKVLSKGAGHLQNTSLPIGGEGTHSVISAHTAYPGETFFDYLTDMEIGDDFYIHVLDRVLKYEVDQIKIVLPENTEDYRIISGEDHVTLLTCTPYSSSTHRLLVRGKRVEYDDSSYVSSGAHLANFGDSCMFFLGYKIPYIAFAFVIVGFIAVVVLLILFVSKRSRKRIEKISEKSFDN